MKRALFVVNSLSNGGAERVCINMAEELLRQKYEVDFVILQQNDTQYQINEKINVYNLKVDVKNKVMRLIKIFLAKNKLNQLIKEKESEEKYNLITSHLPMANILTRISKISHRAIYVFHTKMSSYDKRNSFLFKMVIKFLYGNRKVVAVSEGVRKEAIEKYKIKAKDITTIYNPIETENIEEKKKEVIALKEKYLLQIGRFNEAKRQDRMVDIFYQGKFYENYKLVFLRNRRIRKRNKRKSGANATYTRCDFYGMAGQYI